MLHIVDMNPGRPVEVEKPLFAHDPGDTDRVPQQLLESGRIGARITLKITQTLPVSLLLSATFAALYLVWFTGLVAVVGLASDALRRPRVKAWIERFTGGALLAFGARLAAH